jgi:hypothetical protein
MIILFRQANNYYKFKWLDIMQLGSLLHTPLLSLKATLKHKNHLQILKVGFSSFSSIVVRHESLSTFVSSEIVEIIEKRFDTSDVGITSATKLSDLDRPNLVYKVGLRSISEQVPQSLILKLFASDKFANEDQDLVDRFNRDWACLEFLNLHQINPRQLYGASKEHRFILMEDLGAKHVSLVDFLTKTDVKAAEDALERFMYSLGNFHAKCSSKLIDYERILLNLNPKTQPLSIDIGLALESMIHKSCSTFSKLGVSYSFATQQEINGVIKSVLMPGAFSTLVHGDICPDNVFDLQQGSKKEMRIIDFEWSFIGSALIDGTYLAMNMPTCWCAKSIPKDLIQSLERIYRHELSKGIQHAVNDDLYNTAYVNACAYWMLQNVAYLDDALEQDVLCRSGRLPQGSLWNAEKNLLRPRIISALENFLDIAKVHNRLPNLQIMSHQLLEFLKIKWPETKPLETYPVFDYLEIKPDCNPIGDVIHNDNNF